MFDTASVAKFASYDQACLRRLSGDRHTRSHTRALSSCRNCSDAMHIWGHPCGTLRDAVHTSNASETIVLSDSIRPCTYTRHRARIPVQALVSTCSPCVAGRPPVHAAGPKHCSREERHGFTSLPVLLQLRLNACSGRRPRPPARLPLCLGPTACPEMFSSTWVRLPNLPLPHQWCRTCVHRAHLTLQRMLTEVWHGNMSSAVVIFNPFEQMVSR